MKSTIVLMISAALSETHILSSDHELLLALIGRTQNWTIKKMTRVTLVGDMIQISVSTGIGAIALIASETLS